MPSSLIIVALAAAWLVVLVPMIARGRQEVARTSESALTGRVVRRGSTRSEWRKEFAVADNDKAGDEVPADDELLDDELLDEDYDADDTFGGSDYDDYDDPGHREELVEEREAERRHIAATYRPGRGGFDPEAAEIAARAKYGFRQRIVVGLILTAILTAVLGAIGLTALWWVHGAADVGLVGYLVYLRRQVRIEEDIRQRRLARLHGVPRRGPRRFEDDSEQDYSRDDVREYERDEADPGEMTELEYAEDVEVINPSGRDVVGAERRPMPTSRTTRRQAVVVDLDDEDPAFHELADPGMLPYRRAAGE